MTTFHIFSPSFFSFFSFRQLDLLLAALIPLIATIQAPSPIKRRLAGGEATLSELGGAPDHRRSRQNRTVRFLKLDYPVSSISSRSFRLVFNSCGNIFW
jgi:hypothetical protein